MLFQSDTVLYILGLSAAPCYSASGSLRLPKTYEEILRDESMKDSKLGSGSQGVVYKYYGAALKFHEYDDDLPDGRAEKIFRKEMESAVMLREIKSFSQLLDYRAYDDEHFCSLWELGLSDLTNVQKKVGDFNTPEMEPLALYYLQQWLEAVDETNQAGLSHSDVTLNNALLMQDFTLKMTDCGTVKPRDTQYHMDIYPAAENFQFMAPELLNLWALGVCIYKFVVGENLLTAADDHYSDAKLIAIAYDRIAENVGSKIIQEVLRRLVCLAIPDVPGAVPCDTDESTSDPPKSLSNLLGQAGYSSTSSNGNDADLISSSESDGTSDTDNVAKPRGPPPGPPPMLPVMLKTNLHAGTNDTVPRIKKDSFTQ